MKEFKRKQNPLNEGIHDAQFLDLKQAGEFYRMRFLVLDDSLQLTESICSNERFTRDGAEARLGCTIEAAANDLFRVRLLRMEWNGLLTVEKFKRNSFIFPPWFVPTLEESDGSRNGERNSPLKDSKLAAREMRCPKYKATLESRAVLRDGIAGRLTDDECEFFFGCHHAELIAHIESGFLEGWSWQNRGSVWQIGHKHALARMNLLDWNDFATAHHYMNLKAQDAEENRAAYCN